MESRAPRDRGLRGLEGKDTSWDVSPTLGRPLQTIQASHRQRSLSSPFSQLRSQTCCGGLALIPITTTATMLPGLAPLITQARGQVETESGAICRSALQPSPSRRGCLARSRGPAHRPALSSWQGRARPSRGPSHQITDPSSRGGLPGSGLRSPS